MYLPIEDKLQLLAMLYTEAIRFRYEFGAAPPELFEMIHLVEASIELDLAALEAVTVMLECMRALQS